MALVYPTVFADAVNARLDSTMRIGRIAFDATSAVPEALEYGDIVHFPTLKRVAEAMVVSKGVPMTPANVDMNDIKAPIRQVGSSVRVYDQEAAQIKGTVMDKMIQQVADAMAKRLDADLVEALDADMVYKQAAASENAITEEELMATLGLFGDDIDTASFAGIVVNSRLVPSLLGMNAFTSAEKTFNRADQANGIVINGVIGYFIGIPVIVCDTGTYSGDECKTYIVKRDALGYVFQRDIKVEEERESKLLATDIVASSLYAVKLLDDRGAAVLRKTVGG